MKRGFLLGKFYPFHKGHQYLMEWAVRNCDELTILVCSIPEETIPGELRYRWVKDTFPQCQVYHHPHPIPQEPREHILFWHMWERLIRSYHPEPIDVVFSSEDYGDQLAEVLGAVHICVDLKRETVPISGTMMRAAPYANWAYLTEAAKPYFVKKVLIHGPMSVGKSTLVTKLAAQFAGVDVQECARAYLAEQGRAKVLFSDLDMFAVEQHRLISQATKEGKPILFIDTDAITTSIYSKEYFRGVSPLVEQYRTYEKYDLILLLKADVPFVVEPGRTHGEPKERERMDMLFQKALEDQALPYVVVEGDWDRRLQTAEEAVRKLLE